MSTDWRAQKKDMLEEMLSALRKYQQEDTFENRGACLSAAVILLVRLEGQTVMRRPVEVAVPSLILKSSSYRQQAKESIACRS